MQGRFRRRDVAALAVTAWGVARMASFARRRAPRTLGRVTADVVAVVPARDEERHVASCVRALLAAGVREVVVVDDASSDRTSDAARREGARVVTAPPLAPGHAGKAAACLAGAAAVEGGDWLWFVDADVTVAPDCLSRLLAHADETGAALVSAYGSVLTPAPALAWLLPEVGLSLARRDPAPFASGMCLLVRRAAYPGHDPAAVVEDVALARAMGGASTVLGPDLYRVAMYDSLRDALRGLHRSRSAVPPGWREALWLAAACSPYGYASQVAVSAAARAVSRAPVWPAVGAPLADALLVATRLWPGPATWKGRRV